MDPKLLITANQNEGVSLIDHRKPNRPIMRYGKHGLKSKSAMCAKFCPDGTKIFALGLRMNPLIYDISSPRALAEFDHPGYFNSCTMKSGAFTPNGYVLSGSDDFNVYVWKVPDFPSDQFRTTVNIKRADFVLRGHRSIVNQVRFNSTYNVIATSGEICDILHLTLKWAHRNSFLSKSKPGEYSNDVLLGY